MMLLASCQDVTDEAPQGDTVAVASGYPRLQTVPPRPQLSYTVEQRRAIVNGLIADRENARYTDGLVRYRTGLTSVLPLPPPAPLPVEPAPPGAADAAAASGAARDRQAPTPETEYVYDDDKLDSFMQDMITDRIPPPSEADPGSVGEPEANTAPLGSGIIPAGAARPAAAAASYAGRAPGVVWGIPPETASVPDDSGLDAIALPADDAWRAPVAPAPARPALAAPIETARAGRAPAVVWGMPDLAEAPAEADQAGRAPAVVWGMPDLAQAPAEPTFDATLARASEPGTTSGVAPLPPAPPKPVLTLLVEKTNGHEHPAGPIETDQAGRAPAVVWAIPAARAQEPAEPIAAETATRARDAESLPEPPEPAPAKPVLPAPIETVDANAQGVAPIETGQAGHAPAVVWAIPAAMAQELAEPIAAETATRARDAESLPEPPEPAPAKPVLPAPIETVDASAQGVAPLETALTDRPIPQPLLKPAAGTTGIEVADGLVAIEVALADERDIALGSIAFSPGSAMLPPDAGPQLEQLLAETKAPEARIKIVGEAAWPALALDRARAVGLALVRSGMPADRLELTLARGASGDRARLFLAAPAP